jgi:hypothetical protein
LDHEGSGGLFRWTTPWKSPETKRLWATPDDSAQHDVQAQIGARDYRHGVIVATLGPGGVVGATDNWPH